MFSKLKKFLNKTIIIFGSSAEGRYIQKILKTYNIIPAYYIDNNIKKIGTEYSGIYHLAVNKVQNMQDYLILIPPFYYKQMAAQLKQLNIPKKNIILFDLYGKPYIKFDVPYKIKFYLFMHKYFIKNK